MRAFSFYSLTQQRFREAEYRERDYWVVHDKWKQRQEWYKTGGDADSPSLVLTGIIDWLLYSLYATSWEWIEKSVTLSTKYGIYEGWCAG